MRNADVDKEKNSTSKYKRVATVITVSVYFMSVSEVSCGTSLFHSVTIVLNNHDFHTRIINFFRKKNSQFVHF